MSIEECKCHCHNDHEGAGLSNPEVHCKCLPNCEHCNPYYKKPEVKQRTTHIIKFGKNVRGIRLEFDEDGNFTEIAIDYGEPDNS